MKINTTGGQIHGITQDGLDIFLGIPYAEPPVHDNRFKHSTLKHNGQSQLMQPKYNPSHRNQTTN